MLNETALYMPFLRSIRKKTVILGGFILLALIILPFTLFFFQQKETIKSNAEKTVTLSYIPDASQTTPQLQIPAGSTFSVDVYVDPGTNSISYLKLEMLYDPTKFKPAGGFIPDLHVFSQVVEGPIDQPGKVTATLSIGTDLSKALKVRTKVGTLTLKALETAPANSVTDISFGNNSTALSVSGNSSYGENVIANTTPVAVQINKPHVSCGTTPSDVMLAIDTSDSMLDRLGTGTKLSSAKAAADNFINLIAQESSIRVGVTTFDIGSNLRSGLTQDYQSVKSIIDNDTHTGNQTCMQCGILTANQEISAHKRPGVKNIIILLTDGEALNYIGQRKDTYNKTLGERYALAAAEEGYKTNGTVFYTIGLGDAHNFDPDFLKEIADKTGGKYYYSPNADQLSDIYNQISQTLLGGSVSGTVFNDANGNGVFEPTEPGFPGVLLQLYPLGSSTPTALVSTSSDGTYNLQHLCDGTYTIKQEVPTTWKQTLPADPRGYTFNMLNGKAVTNQNFGDVKLPRCSDGIDNDGNGFADEKDSTCHTDGNPNNPGSYDPNLNGEHGNSTCSDSKDNNGNGLIDGQDPACHVDGNAENPSSYDPSRDEGLLPTSTPTQSPTSEPTQTPIPTPALSPTCTPRPACLDASPACTIAEPVGGWCPRPSVSPTPSPILSPTPTPTGTQLSANILLHGIGDSGDNANPTASSLSNKDPLHPTRNATAYIYDVNNNLISTASGTVKYSSSSGSFIGTLYADSILAAGKYTVKVRTDTHLIKLIPGIITIAENQPTILPAVALVAGDANNDNQLNILDYNLLLDCYSDLTPAVNCDATKKVMTDLNDDGSVNQFDYNLFLREISTQPGE